MSLQSVLVAGKWQTLDTGASFAAVNPATKQALEERYPVSGEATLETALSAGREAATALRRESPQKIARFLERCAENLEERADELVEMAHLETGYPKEPRLRSGELPRTTNQLRQAAESARDGSFRVATIDTKNNLRSLHAPMGGPVFVFGPNNFPFAFNGVMGGDFAAAIAAGNPVIAKAHPSHPGTSRLLAEAAFKAVKASELPPSTVQLIYHMDRALGLKVVAHPALAAVSFTGSRQAGLALKAAADPAGTPIYLEMSSVNPIFILPGALQERAEEIANELFSSCTLGAGQFCTNPGMSVVVGGPSAEAFLSTVKGLFESTPGGTLLSETATGNLRQCVKTLIASGAELVSGGSERNSAGYSFDNTLLRVSGDQFLNASQALQTEAFGSVHMMVFVEGAAQMARVADCLEGNLTGCIYSDRAGSDDAAYTPIAFALRPKVGRLLNDKMPTGVAVSPAMNHGGPFPATGHPGFTAVGMPASLRRFTALHCYDGVRPERLPPELGDENPTGKMWRIIDGQWSQGNV